MRRSRGFRLLSFSSMVLAGLALAAGSLTFTERPAQAQTPEDDIQAMLDAAAAAWNEQDVETFVSFWTEDVLREYFDIGEGDPIAVLMGEFEGTGPIASITASNVFVTSGNASGFVDIQFEAGFAIFEEWEFTFVDQMWKVSNTEPAFRPIPEGVPAVPMQLQEYAFVYNAAAIQAADGNFAFDVANVGREAHEIVVVEITTDAPLGAVVDAIAEAGEEEEPEGVQFVEFLGFFDPGQSGTGVLSMPLAEGRYGLICFVEAPDGTPHAFLGMVSEFSISGGGPVDDDDDGVAPIRPPSTGDAGLLGTGAGSATWLLLGVALTLVLGGAAGLLATRRA